MPQHGEARANFHAGGSARAAILTLREQGLVFVGIDVIGDYMTEINVTSPTGIQEINRLSGVQLERTLWNAIEVRLGVRASSRSYFPSTVIASTASP